MTEPTGTRNPGRRKAAPGEVDGRFHVSLTLTDGYAFAMSSGMNGVPGIVIDEPPPLSKGVGPNPTRVLAGSLAACLGSSLLYCLNKARVEVRGIRVEVDGTTVRNERGRLRAGPIAIRIVPDIPESDRPRAKRCLEVFEDYCVVTEAVRQGIPVEVRVESGE
jgi:uncharacterized OsmC-like protein